MRAMARSPSQLNRSTKPVAVLVSRVASPVGSINTSRWSFETSTPMLKMTVIFNIGVDVSKDHLDVFMLPTGEATRLTNTATGFVDLFNWLGDRAIARIVFEATGAYHKSFEQALSARGM